MFDDHGPLFPVLPQNHECPSVFQIGTLISKYPFPGFIITESLACVQPSALGLSVAQMYCAKCSLPPLQEGAQPCWVGERELWEEAFLSVSRQHLTLLPQPWVGVLCQLLSPRVPSLALPRRSESFLCRLVGLNSFWDTHLLTRPRCTLRR